MAAVGLASIEFAITKPIKRLNRTPGIPSLLVQRVLSPTSNIKYLKRGYSRVSQMVALDLRNGRITKERGEQLVEDFEGRKPPSLELFLDYVGLDEPEFNEIVSHTVVPPNKPDFHKNEWAPKTHDFETWYRERDA